MGGNALLRLNVLIKEQAVEVKILNTIMAPKYSNVDIHASNSNKIQANKTLNTAYTGPLLRINLIIKVRSLSIPS